MALKAVKAGPVTDLFQEYGLFGRYLLTKKGTLLGALEFDGRDPDGLSANDFTAMALIARSLYQGAADGLASITQYYVHFKGARCRLRERDNPVSSHLSKRREAFLNRRHLNASRIVHFFEVAPDENITRLNPLSFIKHLVRFPGSKSSRVVIKNWLSARGMTLCFLEDLKRQVRKLDEITADATGRWESIFSGRVLSPSEMWAYLRFFANLDPGLLTSALDESVPDAQWDGLLSEGSMHPVVRGQADFLKFDTLSPVYARMLSAVRFGEHAVPGGLWAQKPKSPVRQPGNFILMTRFSPLGKIRQSLMFTAKKKELHRKNLDFFSLFRGLGEGDETSRKARMENMKPGIAKKLRELEAAETLDERWGRAHAFAIAFGNAPSAVNETLGRLRKSMLHSGMSVVVEGPDLPDAYKTFLPAGREHSVRDMEMNATQFGAISLLYRATEGQVQVADLGGEEAQYILMSADGTPFHYSPFVGQRCLTIIIGPIRSGKTFAKNTLAAHFLKYGGVYRAIDIDPGTETLAQFFGEDGAVFRIGEAARGFNPFAVAGGETDFAFISHIKNTVLEMLKANENESLRRLEAHEQKQLDAAIVATLKLPDTLRRFSTMVNHCPRELQEKLARFTSGGMYGFLYDQTQDAIGALDKKVAAFNLAGVKDDPTLFPLTMSEIFYRVTRMFEDPAHRATPKYLDIDEAHALLKIPYAREYIVRSIRTWGKWKGGIGLCSQDVNEFLRIEDWEAVRAAAATFFFMADPTLNPERYQAAFELTAGECDAIRNLRPKGEAYIIQREIGVSKKVILEVEPEQYVISTSRPEEVALRQEMIARHGFKRGIEKTASALGLFAREKERAA